MSLFVLGLVVTIILFIALGFRQDRTWKSNPKQLFSIIGVLIMLLSFVAKVPANAVGILYSPFQGGVQDRVYQEGFNLKSPFDEMYMISTEVQTKTIENLSGQTKDSQYLTIAVDVKYYIDKDKAFDVFKKFKTLENVNSYLVSPSAQRAIESACVNYNIMEILGSKREEVYKKIEIELQDRFSKDGITLHSITFQDTDAGDDVENAIRAEAVAKKEVETAMQRKTKAEVEAETRIIQAEAEAKEKEILALAIASSPEILELEWIKKWNGELPYFMAGSGTDGIMIEMPEMDLDGRVTSAPPTTTETTPTDSAE